jgi:uncharacterized protein DUF6526
MHRHVSYNERRGGQEEMTEQSFRNHTRWYPPFHFFVMPMFAINFGWSIYRWRKAGFSVDASENMVMAAALITFMITARLMALKVQDRVIRLEERLRCERLLPADLRPRIGELKPRQLVVLRFASDAELPDLAREVLDGKLMEGKSIKQRVKNWRPDYLRA